MCDIYIFNTYFIGAGEVAPRLREITTLAGKPLFWSQNLHSKAQLSATPVPGRPNSLLPSVGTTYMWLWPLWAPHACGTHTYVWAEHINVIFVKLF